MFPFTLRQIELFQTTSECGSFSAAAEKLGISQPTVSQQMAVLERQLGFNLFIRRRGGGVHLTPEGSKFHRDGQEFIAAGRQLAQNRRSNSENKVTSLRLYIGSHILEDFVRPNLWKIYDVTDSVELKFISVKRRIFDPAELVDRKVDIGVFLAPHWQESRSFSGLELLGKINAGIYGHKNYASGNLNAEVISKLPFMLPPAGSEGEINCLRFLANENVIPTNVVARSPYHDVDRKLWENGIAVGFGVESMIWSLMPDVVCLLASAPWTIVFYQGPGVDACLASRLKAFIGDCLKEGMK